MKIGIIGLTGSGKTTIFDLLKGKRGEEEREKAGKIRIATVIVQDPRLDYIKEILRPKKITYPRIEYLLPSRFHIQKENETISWAEVRACDGFLHVLRNFKIPGLPEPDPERDFWELEQEMILNDLMVSEKRIERLKLDQRKGKKIDPKEMELLEKIKGLLEDSIPLRSEPLLAHDPDLRPYSFLSSKPQFIVINNEDDDTHIPKWKRTPDNVGMMAIRAKIEMEIASLLPDEREEFMKLYNINESLVDRLIRESYRMLDVIHFYTVVGDESKAWEIQKGTPCIEAAGAVHTDMKKGFIKAEVISFEDLKRYGSLKEARNAGVFRLEGKDYVVQDGDIINFRFKV